jgi:hypothetical protein
VPLALIRHSPLRCKRYDDEGRGADDEEAEGMMTMMKRSIGVVVAVVMSCVLAGSAVAATPITGVTPTTAVAGQTITISGSGLNGTQSVTFGNVQALPVVVDPAGNWVKVDVPSGVQPGQVTITLSGDGGTYSTPPITIQPGSISPPQPLPSPGPATAGSSATPSKLVPAPEIRLFLPAAGKVGSKVTIFGSNFVRVSWVKLGGKTVKFAVISPSRLRLTVPRGAHTGKLSVRASGGTGVSGKSLRVVKASAV